MTLSDRYHRAKFWIGQHPFYSLIIGVVLCAALWYGGGALLNGASELHTSGEVHKTEAQATQAEAQAGASKQAADQTAIDRQVEDQLRERTITPEVRRSERQAAETRARVRDAEANYEKVTKDRSRSPLGPDALHERNCSDLRDLYPGEEFAGCR